MLRLFIITTLFLFSASPLAQNTELTQRLLANISQHETNIADNKEEIESYTEKKASLQQKLTKALEALAAAKAAAELAEVQHGGNPNPENERTLKRASDLKTLAERKVDSRRKRVEWISNKVIELEEDSERSNTAISRNQSRLSKIKREQTAKAETKKNAAQAAVQAQKKSPALVVAPVQADLPEPAPIPAEKTAPVAKPAVAKAVAPVVAIESEDNNSAELDEEERAYVAKRMASIQEFLASGPSLKADISRLRGNIKQGEDLSFEHLGGEIYKAESPLQAGSHIIRIKGSSFKVFVSESYDGEMHSFYFDARSKYKRKLIAFRSSLMPN